MNFNCLKITRININLQKKNFFVHIAFEIIYAGPCAFIYLVTKGQ
jgi:hypothetical protein